MAGSFTMIFLGTSLREWIPKLANAAHIAEIKVALTNQKDSWSRMVERLEKKPA